MGILDTFRLSKSGAFPKNASFRLTQDGREKLQSYSGTPQARILAALESCGSSDRNEISNAAGLSRGQVERNLLVLWQKGYVQRSGSGMGGGLMDGMGDDI